MCLGTRTTYPACRECNGCLRDIPLLYVPLRAAYLLERYRTRRGITRERMRHLARTAQKRLPVFKLRRKRNSAKKLYEPLTQAALLEAAHERAVQRCARVRRK